MKEPFRNYVRTKLGNRFVLITCGLPGTWKTETSEDIAKIKGYPLLRTDLFRLNVLKGQDIFDEKVASNMDKRLLVYDAMFKAAEESLVKGEGVILDATFVKQSLRKRAAELAAKAGRRFIILQTSCPQEASIRRILSRTKDKYESNALTEQAYLDNKKKFEAVDMEDIKKAFPYLPATHLTVDTTYDPPELWFIIGEESINKKAGE
ncbi:AAA family ATPase [Chloroflexota bacterium]